MPTFTLNFLVVAFYHFVDVLDGLNRPESDWNEMAKTIKEVLRIPEGLPYLGGENFRLGEMIGAPPILNLVFYLSLLTVGISTILTLT